MGPLEAVEDLIRCRPDKARELLLRYCTADQGVLNEILTSLLAAKSGQEPRPTSSYDMDVALATRHQAQQAEHVRPPHRVHQPSTNTRQYSLLSPPGTESVTSHSVKDEANAGEDIILMIATEQGIRKEMVRMRTALVEHCLINEVVINNRGLGPFVQRLLDQPYVSVPRGADFEDSERLRVSLSIKLTWRRSRAGSSDVTLFYVVPHGVMDTDVVLGIKDSGEDTSGYVKTATQRQREYGIIGQHHNPPPPEPDLPLPHHLSALYDGSSVVTATQQRDLGHKSTVHRWQQSQQSRVEQHPVRAPTSQAGMPPAADPNKPLDRIRLNIMWDTTSINVWLGLHESSENFFREFQKETAKRKKTITDRSLLTINVSNDKSIPDEPSYRLELEENALCADWDTTTGWLEKYQRDKAPHVFGRVEVDD